MGTKDPDENTTPQSSSSSNDTTIGTNSIIESEQKHGNEEYDYVEKEIDEDLICSICLLPFIDPISHNSCGNTFCSKCVETVPNCPMCGEGEFKKNCVPSVKMIRNLLDKLKVKCGMCKNIVLRGELKDHQDKYCPLHEAYQQVDEFKKKLEQEFQQRVQKLESEHQELMKEWNEKILHREKFEMSNKPIHLNVGGTIMTASLGTFIHNEREPDNLFKKMFTGQHPCYLTPSKQFDDPIYFIDCDVIVFKHILEWMKFETIPNELSIDMKQYIVNACKMFGLSNMLMKNENKSSIGNSSSEQDTDYFFQCSCIIRSISIAKELYAHTKSKSIPELLYRGSRDGFTAQQFHSKCDNQGPTLTIIKSAEHNQIFGAFTSQSWKSSHENRFVSDSAAFIFKVTEDSTNELFHKFNIKQDKKHYAIYLDKNSLPTFGGGCDLSISSDCNLNNKSQSNFGFTFDLPNGYKKGSSEASSYLAGSDKFKVSDIEVWKINLICF